MSNSTKIPRKLAKPPLVEAIFEVRFAPKVAAAGDLLVGMLYDRLKTYKTVQTLPTASIPREVGEADPNLRYLPSHHLVREFSRVIVGDRVVGISQSAPYEGWAAFRGDISVLLDVVQSTELIDKIERYSLKYVNIIAAVGDSQLLPLLRARFEIGDKPVPERGFRFRSEFENAEFTTILEIVTGAAAKNAKPPRQGLLVQVDTIRMRSPEGLFESKQGRLDELHGIVESLFFNLIGVKTLEALEPVWE
jgi:uncharacterized protein (TIGR04255 family)